MDRFFIQQPKGRLPLPGFYSVIHTAHPRCEIGIIDLHFQKNWESLDDIPEKKLHFRDANGKAHSYQLFVSETEGDEADTYQVLEDCWGWWMEWRIRENQLYDMAIS